MFRGFDFSGDGGDGRKWGTGGEVWGSERGVFSVFVRKWEIKVERRGPLSWPAKRKLKDICEIWVAEGSGVAGVRRVSLQKNLILFSCFFFGIGLGRYNRPFPLKTENKLWKKSIYFIKHWWWFRREPF